MYKNIDDVLITGNNIIILEERLERMLKVCVRKNMKLHPDKLQIGRRVTFGGVTIEASKTKGDEQRRVYMSPSEDKLQTFLDLKTPKSKVEVQRVCGMAAQMKKFCPGLMLTFPRLQKLSAHNTSFKWDDELQSEFENLKTTLKESVKLSPLDIKKRIFAYTDAAVTCGMCYLLVQKKVESDDDKNPENGYLIISCDSTTFRRAQCQYSPFEAELLAIQWMCEKEDYNIRGSKQVLVFSDAKNMGQFIKSDLQSVKNPRCFRMLERLLPYDICVEYKPGTKMAVADYGSRAPMTQGDHREFRITDNDIGVKVKTNRVKTLNIRDHSLTKLAALGKEDAMYCRMIDHIQKGTKLNMVEEECELNKLRGDFQNIGLFITEEGPLIVRDSSNILIPEIARQTILDELHSTHLSVEYMKAMARNRFFWPGLQEDLHNIFKACRACKRESASKPNTRRYNTVPPDLLQMSPAEEISTDFMSYGTQSILVIKDKQTGYIAAKLCRDKTTKSALEALKMWFYSYGFSSTVRSDGGPCFKETFSHELDKMGVKHVLSSAHNPQSNGGAERVCKSIREVLDKRGGNRTDQLELSELCFKVNAYIQPGGRGSAHERFHRRCPKTLLPGTMKDHVEYQDMIKKRHENQLNISRKKGRAAVDEFLINDHVLIQNNLNGKWEEEGIIKAYRRADDNSVQSYEIEMSSGTVKIRNKRFIKHISKSDTCGERHVKFKLNDNTDPQHDNSRDQEEHRGADTGRAANSAGPLTRSKART